MRAFAIILLVLAALVAVSHAQDSRTYNGWCNSNRRPGKVRSLRVTSDSTTSVIASWREPSGHECVRCVRVVV